MKTITIDWLRDILLAVLDGSVKIQLVPTKKKGKRKALAIISKASEKNEKEQLPKKRGRKPLSARQKEINAEARKKRKARLERKNLPLPRDIYLYLYGKVAGETLTRIAQHFAVRRSVLKPHLQKLVEKEDLTIFQGAYSLKRAVRNIPGRKIEKTEPVSDEKILSFVKKNPGKSMGEIANGLGFKNHHRLIQPMRRLKKSGKVVEKNKSYKLP